MHGVGGLDHHSDHPKFWSLDALHPAAPVDPTPVIQGVITGVSFLCAGVIMKDGLNISCLTTSASLWAAAAIGVMMGIGMYISAVLVTMLSLACMMGVSKLESRLPARPAIAMVPRFSKQFSPNENQVRAAATRWGYDVARGSFTIQC